MLHHIRFQLEKRTVKRVLIIGTSLFVCFSFAFAQQAAKKPTAAGSQSHFLTNTQGTAQGSSQPKSAAQTGAKPATQKPGQAASQAAGQAAGQKPGAQPGMQPGQAPQQAAQKRPTIVVPNYDDVLKRVKAHDTTASFFLLRISYARNKKYMSNYAVAATRTQNCLDLYNSGKFAEAASLLDTAINDCFACMTLHDLAYKANWMLDTTSQKAEFHRWVFYNMLKSMVTGVTGRSFTDPVTVIHEREEQALLAAMSLKQVSQKSVKKNGHSFDVITCTDASNKEVVMHFLTDIPLRGYLKLQ